MSLNAAIILSKQKLSITFAALKHKNFRYFWIGQCVSLMGTWMQRTAQVWLVYSLTKSPFLLGILGVCQFGPMLLFSLFAGVFVDRFPKKRILWYTQVLFFLQSLAMGLLAWTGHIQYTHILILGAVFGLAQTLDMPARQSFFIELVGKEDLMNAISLNSTIVNLSRIIGPAVAGLLMMEIGATPCFFLNSASYLAVFYGLTLIKAEEKQKKRMNKGILKEIKEGLRYIYQSDELKFTFAMMAVVCTFAMNVDVIAPVFSKIVLHRGADAYSILLAAAGAGSFIASLIMASRSKKGVKIGILIGDALLVSVIQITASFNENYILTIILVLIMGFLNLTFLNMANSSLQMNASDEYRGRVMSVYGLLNMGSTPIGNFYTGVLMEKFGAQMGFRACGIATLLLALLVIYKFLGHNFTNKDS